MQAGGIGDEQKEEYRPDNSRGRGDECGLRVKKCLMCHIKRVSVHVLYAISFWTLRLLVFI